MDAFAGEFLDRQARYWKARTLESNTYLVRKYIVLAFGHLAVDAITVEYVKDWFASMADRPGSANRAISNLSVMIRMAGHWGYRRHNSNPCKTPSDTGYGRRRGSSPPRKWPGSTPC